MPKLIGYIWTMIIVIIGWTIFKASNLHNAATYLRFMIGIGNKIADQNTILYLKSASLFFAISYIGVFPIFGTLKKWINNKILVKIGELLWIPFSAVLLGICLLIIINGSYSPFIYFNF